MLFHLVLPALLLPLYLASSLPPYGHRVYTYQQSPSGIISQFNNSVETIIETANMENAVQSAFRLADAGDTVLLSPACSSFDLFKNYEDRGRSFKNCVLSI